ncbi:EboA domain-containing protein [uncultured Hymenobacter sp.]|uniref:EboA domain-containing protein n=1 Tax=uncultured Hymenobacter sp. TaxID=170016 RepID=UPI0035CAF13F
MAPRFVGKQPLSFTAEHLREAHSIRPGFNPQVWTADQAARTLLLLHAPHQSPSEYIAKLDRLFSTADLGELVALYAALPLLPYPELHVQRAAEGVRTTMTSVFDAIALRNPYPHDYLPEEAWNQLVLKAVFNARPLHQIYGLDQRRNASLAQMLLDYAHERWAAGRTLTPEVWRLMGPYLTADHRPDLQRLLLSNNALENQAAFLALSESNNPIAKELLSQFLTGEQASQPAFFTWQSIGESAYTS